MLPQKYMNNCYSFWVKRHEVFAVCCRDYSSKLVGSVGRTILIMRLILELVSVIHESPPASDSRCSGMILKLYFTHPTNECHNNVHLHTFSPFGD